MANDDWVLDVDWSKSVGDLSRQLGISKQLANYHKNQSRRVRRLVAIDDLIDLIADGTTSRHRLIAAASKLREL